MTITKYNLLKNSVLPKLLLLVFISFFIAMPSIAQIDVDEKLALQFYQNKEYDKAADIYRDIYDKKPNPFYYDYYLNCLFELKEYKTAEKFVSSVARKNSKNIKFKVEHAYVLQMWGKNDKAKKEYKKLIKNLESDRKTTIDLSTAFVARDLNDYAIKTFVKSKSKITDPPLNIELAELYLKTGNYVEMANEYLDMVIINDKYIAPIKGKLQLIISDPNKEAATEAIRDELLKRTQKNSGQTIYAELLYWYSIQKKDFELATIQAIALDKQFNEQGERVYNLSKILMSNKQWEYAIQSYNYIIEMGPMSMFYVNAEINVLDAKFNKITSNNNYTEQEIIDLKGDYNVQLKAFGKNASTSTLMMNLAHIEAFYLDDLESAKTLLTEVQNIPNISKQQKAEAKLMLGDMKLFSGEKWSASLLYKQVEKENKNDAIGFQAKFKAAQFYYYVGEMEWAKSQLNVLRGATSKLIANNSMELYLLIQENISQDSTYDALNLYAKADLLLYQQQYETADIMLDTIINIFPNHPIIDDAYFKKAEIAMAQKNFAKADSLYEQTVDYAPFGTLADNAIMNRAKLYDGVLNDLEKAAELYQEILLNYPGSLFTVDARKRYREIKEK